MIVMIKANGIMKFLGLEGIRGKVTVTFSLLAQKSIVYPQLMTALSAMKTGSPWYPGRRLFNP